MLKVSPSRTYPLPMAKTGEPLRLAAIHGGRRAAHRLAELGLTPGVELTVLQNAGGPMILIVRGSRIALGKGLAHKLAVIPSAEVCDE